MAHHHFTRDDRVLLAKLRVSGLSVHLCVLLQSFIEQHHTQIKISDKLRAKVDKHMYVTKTLLTHYKVDKQLDDPFVEYARYVLKNGTENERITLTAGIETRLQIRESKLEFYT